MRIGSALAMLIASEVLLRYARARALPAAAVTRLAWLAWGLTRPILALFVFLILEVPLHSDAVTHYLPQARDVLTGELVYRDFRSSYGPLFAYLAAAVIALGTSPLAFVGAALGFEALAILLWSRSTQARPEAAAEALLVYACTPSVIWDVALEAHNQAWLSAGLALAVFLGARGRWLAAGLALALTAASVKLLALVVAPVLLACAARPLRFAVGLALGLSLLHAPLAYFGADPLQPLTTQSGYWTSGNVPFVLALLWPGLLEPGAAPLRSCVLLFGLLASAIATRTRAGASRSAPSTIEAALCLGFYVFLLLSQKAYAHYAVMVWLPACLLLARDGLTWPRRALLYALGLLATVEPALWFHALDQSTLSHARATPAISPGILSLFVAVELALLAAYTGLLRAAWLGLVQSKAP
jgi:hypothetical protein